MSDSDEPLILRRIRPTHAEGWKLMPHVLTRVARFCEKHPTELNPTELLQLIKTHFLDDSPVLGLWAVSRDDTIVAHLFAAYDRFHSVAFVYQLEIDVHLPLAIRRAAALELDLWARECGAKAIDAVTWHDTRVWRRYGFQPHRAVVRRVLA